MGADKNTWKIDASGLVFVGTHSHPFPHLEMRKKSEKFSLAGGASAMRNSFHI